MKGLVFALVGTLMLFLSGSVAFGAESIPVDRDVVYRSVEGVSLQMDIYHPTPTKTKVPVIVYIHGGGWYSGDKTTGAGQADISGLVKRGYAVVSVDYRLAPRYKFPAQIEDLKCAIRFLRENTAAYSLNADRIGVFGDSAGGHLAALLGVTDESYADDCGASGDCCNTRVQAVVDMFGPADLSLMFKGHDLMLMEHVFNVTDPECEVIQQASPQTYVTPDDPPFLILHGDEDDVVFSNQSEGLYEKLVSQGVPANLVMVKNAGHNFDPIGGAISPTRSEITDKMADFFDQHLR
jgi:acetyl esterase/lipase